MTYHSTLSMHDLAYRIILSNFAISNDSGKKDYCEHPDMAVKMLYDMELGQQYYFCTLCQEEVDCEVSGSD